MNYLKTMSQPRPFMQWLRSQTHLKWTDSQNPTAGEFYTQFRDARDEEVIYSVTVQKRIDGNDLYALCLTKQRGERPSSEDYSDEGMKRRCQWGLSHQLVVLYSSSGDGMQELFEAARSIAVPQLEELMMAIQQAKAKE